MTEDINDEDDLLEILYTRKWEAPKPGVGKSFYKGLGIGFLLMAGVLGICWALVNWL